MNYGNLPPNHPLRLRAGRESNFTPQEALKKVLNQIKERRDALSVAGCRVGTYWFHNDLKSRSQWERMVNRANNLNLADADGYVVDNAPVAWKTQTGEYVVLTAGLIREVVLAFEIQEKNIFQAAEIKRGELANAADPLVYVWDKDWPEVYVKVD